MKQKTQKHAMRTTEEECMKRITIKTCNKKKRKKKKKEEKRKEKSMNRNES